MPGYGARADVPGAPVWIGPPWSVVGVGDFNGDGAADILWHNSSTNETQIWFMSAYQIQWRQAVEDEGGAPIIVGLPWSIVGVGDMNNDGKADIVWHNSATNETQIWYMNGNYKINHRSTVEDEGGAVILIGAPWSIVGAGTSEIFWHSSATNETQIWHMNSNGHISTRVTVEDEGGRPILVGLPWSISAISDEYHDGSSDIVWHNSDTGETQIWILNSNGTIFKRRTIVGENGLPKFVNDPWAIVGAGDIDGNSYYQGQYLGSDVLWYNSATGELKLWFLNYYQNQIAFRSDIYNDPDGPSPQPPTSPPTVTSLEFDNCYGVFNGTTRNTTVNVTLWYRDVTRDDYWNNSSWHFTLPTNWTYRPDGTTACLGRGFTDWTADINGDVYEFRVVNPSKPGCYDQPTAPDQCILDDFERRGDSNSPSGAQETITLSYSA
ncbi:MAG TPA: VCBS repeat-containing protein [Streptosporangiaceae bacterium]|nr:VCBS repeat-containing protein [Streptosporangiaceae bacterium]